MKPGAIISHYEVLSQLGGGGMGVVFKARDTKLGRTVALKFLPPELSTDREANERFIVEAQAASALDHNNICTIYEIGEADYGQLFIAMAFYGGKTLKHWLLERGLKLDTVGRVGSAEVESPDASGETPFDESEVLKIVHQVALGLAAAHEKGIIHRDIKPANIMVTDKGRAVILDFGLAKLPGVLSLTKTGSTLGTAAYMAPEQVRGEAVDGRTDIWSLGVVFYEMLAGHRPFLADYEQALSYAILNQDVAEPPGATAEASTIAMRMLARDPNDRYPNVEALIQDLDAVLEARRTPGGRAVPVSRLESKRLGLQIAIGAVAVMVAVVATLTLTRRGGEVTDGGPEKDVIAIVPFSVRGDPELEYLGNGMVDLLSIRLDGIGEFRTVDPNGLLGLIAKEQLQVSTPSDAVRLANRLGAGRAIMGSVIRAGGTIQISASLYSDPSAPEVEVASVAQEEEAISRSIDELAQGIAIGLTDLPLEAAESVEAMTSSDFAALKSYLNGVHAQRLGRYEESIAHFEKAIALDSTFALPYTLLPVAYAWLGRARKEAEAWKRGFNMRASLSERARMSLEAGYYGFMVGDPERSMEAYKKVLASYPNDVYSLMLMGEVVYHYNPLLGRRQSESREYFERAHVLAGDVGPLEHLAEMAMRDRRLAEADSFSHLIAESIGDAAAAQYYANLKGFTRRADGDSSWVFDDAGTMTVFGIEQLLEQVMASLEDQEAALQIANGVANNNSYPREDRTHFEYRSSISLLAQGRLAQHGEMVRSIDPMWAGHALVEQALTYGLPIYPVSDNVLREARGNLASWDTLAKPLQYPAGNNRHVGEYAVVKTFLEALVALRREDFAAVADAKRFLAERADPESGKDLAFSSLRTLEAMEYFGAGDYGRAVVALDEARLRIEWRSALASSIKEQTFNRMIKAEALLRLGAVEDALEVYLSFMESDGLGKLLYLGPGYLRLAEIYERLGQNEKAVEYYARLLRLWRNCDPGLVPMREEARRNLDRLVRESLQEPPG